MLEPTNICLKNQSFQPSIAETLSLFESFSSKKECWMCNKIANAIKSGKDVSDDEKWHFITCVLSWYYYLKSK